MSRWIVATSLQFRVVILALAAALVGFGLLRLQKMPVDVFPEFAPPVVEVQTEAIGLSAREVESLITLNSEELLSGVPWLESIRSKSVTGLSSILLTFQPGTDIVKARQVVQERLTLAYLLPNVGAAPVMLQPMSATSRFMMVGVSSKAVEPTELSLLARWTIKPKLLGVPGVANVAIWGQRLRQLQVHIDPERLRDARMAQDDLITAAGDALWVSPLSYLKGSAPGTGGFIDNQNQRIGVHHHMPITSPEDLARIPLSPQHLLMTGRQMNIGDVAEVTFSHAPLIGDARLKNGDGLMLVVEKFPGANTLEVTRGVEQALAELGRGLPGVEIDPSVFRLASYVEDSMTNLSLAAGIGAVLALVSLLAFLHSWRGALVALVVIPLSLLVALLALQLAGATLNIMVVTGLLLALGVVIDDAIFDAHRLRARLHERPEGMSALALIRDSVIRTRSIVTYAALIMLLAVLPIFFVGGVTGAFFKPLALAYVLGVVASLLVAMTVTPALALLVMGGQAGNGVQSPAGARMREKFDAALGRVLTRPRTAFVATGAIVALSAALWPFLGQSLLPSLRERELLVHWETAPGTSYRETHRITSRVASELQALEGVSNVGAHIGRAINGDQVVGINASQLWVSLDPKADYHKTVASIRDVVDGYPGVQRNVQSYLRDKVAEVLTGAQEAIVVRLYGANREVLRQKAEEVRLALAGIPGIAELRAEDQAEEPQVKVTVDLEAAGRHNVKPGDVRRSAATVFSGLTVGFLFEEQKMYDVVVWGAPETRASLTGLSDVWVEKQDRRPVRLGDVAKVSIEPSPTVIRHEGISPYVDVVANVAGRDLGSVAKDVRERLAKVQFPLEHHPRLLGEYAERSAAQRQMVGITAASVVAIFLLLHACFGTWRVALVASLALPAAAAGGVLAVLVTGATVSLGSLIGFLAVLGIAARNGLLLMSHYQWLEAQTPAMSARELVLLGTRERLSPILASSATIIAVLLPLALLGQMAGLEIVQPTAIVVIGGLIASTLITLFVMPPLYLRYGYGARRDLNLEPAQGTATA